MKVINLFGGPGSGKSTTAAGLFFKMKHIGLKVELVTEFAKDCTYEGGHTLPDQLAVLGEQHRRLSRLEGHVDWAITDSPLLLGAIYAKGDFDCREFENAVTWAFNRFDNHNFLLVRNEPYSTYGRTQSFEEACEIDDKIKNLATCFEMVRVAGGNSAPEDIFDFLRHFGLIGIKTKPYPSARPLGFPDFYSPDTTDNLTTREPPH